MITAATIDGNGTGRIPPVHPGEILYEEFMLPLSISQNKLSRELKVPPGRINELIKGKRSVSADTSLRLSLFFGTTPEFWMNLQARYDLEVAKDREWARLRREIIPYEAGRGEDCAESMHGVK